MVDNAELQHYSTDCGDGNLMIQTAQASRSKISRICKSFKSFARDIIPGLDSSQKNSAIDSAIGSISNKSSMSAQSSKTPSNQLPLLTPTQTESLQALHNKCHNLPSPRNPRNKESVDQM